MPAAAKPGEQQLSIPKNMNHDLKLASLSAAALGASLVICGNVLFSEPEESDVAIQPGDRALLDGTQKAEALPSEHGSTIPFHWMFERVVQVSRRIY
jgi:hypothetical protein